MEGDRVTAANTLADLSQARFKPLMVILLELAAGAPSMHVRLDLAAGELIDLSEEPSPFRGLIDGAGRIGAP